MTARVKAFLTALSVFAVFILFAAFPFLFVGAIVVLIFGIIYSVALDHFTWKENNE
jgi:4-hydroxybenzoate polyprenyltransferase